MAPRVKKTNRQKQKILVDSLENDKENEKENKYSKISGTKEQLSVKEQTSYKCKEEKPTGNQIISAELNSKVTLKPLGFWSKKLQDLEDSLTNKTCEIYEFSGTDDSESFCTKKKKPKQKAKLKRKQQTKVPLYNHPADKAKKIIKKKVKQIHSQSMCREQILLTKERKKLADSGKKFTFSAGMSSLGITSTPAAKKDNLVGASNFLFLSPIIMEEETDNTNYFNKHSPPKAKDGQNNTIIKEFNQKTPKAKNMSVTEYLNKETPKVKTKLRETSCKRVLRSGKVIRI